MNVIGYLFLPTLLLCGYALASCASDEGRSEPDSGSDGATDASADSPPDGLADAALDSGSGDAEHDDGDADCSGGYHLTSYTGGTAGLCAPDDATMCSCFELTQAVEVTCDSVGGGCVKLPALCDVCGWVRCPEEVAARPPACAQYATELPAVWAGGTTTACSQDAHCGPGQTCNLRVGNRMFCG